jgi:hypothetical protein
MTTTGNPQDELDRARALRGEDGPPAGLPASAPGHSAIRKARMTESIDTTAGAASAGNEIDLVAHAKIQFSSEDALHPIDHAFDGSGKGCTRWASARRDVTEQILLEFDEPQHIARLMYEVEEDQVERTQEVRMEFSSDGGKSYAQAFVQEHTFSPRGSTYQYENLAFDLRGITHLRFTVVPNKGGSGTATLTSLRLFAGPVLAPHTT